MAEIVENTAEETQATETTETTAEQTAAEIFTKYGLCGYYSHICAGPCRIVQFYAHYGGSCSRSCVGFALPSVPKILCGDNNLARAVGCGGIYMVPDNVKLFKNCDFCVMLATKILIYSK